MCIYYDYTCSLLYLQSSDDIKSKLKIQEFGSYCTHTVDSRGSVIYELGQYQGRIMLRGPWPQYTPVYDAVGPNYEVVLHTEKICW